MGNLFLGSLRVAGFFANDLLRVWCVVLGASLTAFGKLLCRTQKWPRKDFDGNEVAGCITRCTESRVRFKFSWYFCGSWTPAPPGRATRLPVCSARAEVRI